VALLGRWAAADGTGSIALDSSGAARHGTLRGSAGWARDNTFRESSLLVPKAATANSLTIPGDVTVDAITAITWLGWFRFVEVPNGTPDIRPIWWRNGPSSLYQMRVYCQVNTGAGPGMAAAVQTAAGNFVTALWQAGSAAFPANVWVHIAATYSNADGLRLFANGIQRASGASGLGNLSAPVGGSSWLIGGRGDVGSITDVPGMQVRRLELHSTVLTPAAIRDASAGSATGKGALMAPRSHILWPVTAEQLAAPVARTDIRRVVTRNWQWGLELFTGARISAGGIIRAVGAAVSGGDVTADMFAGAAASTTVTRAVPAVGAGLAAAIARTTGTRAAQVRAALAAAASSTSSATGARPTSSRVLGVAAPAASATAARVGTAALRAGAMARGIVSGSGAAGGRAFGGVAPRTVASKSAPTSSRVVATALETVSATRSAPTTAAASAGAVLRSGVTRAVSTSTSTIGAAAASARSLRSAQVRTLVAGAAAVGSAAAASRSARATVAAGATPRSQTTRAASIVAATLAGAWVRVTATILGLFRPKLVIAAVAVDHHRIVSATGIEHHRAAHLAPGQGLSVAAFAVD
jgi:hypothetical protein